SSVAPNAAGCGVTSGDDTDLAGALAAVAQALAADDDLAAVIVGICRLAVQTIDGCEHADVMIVVRGGALSVPAATDWVGIRIVSFEEEYGGGACVDAVRTGALVDSADYHAEGRWPRLIQRCLAETPVRSGMALPLSIGDRAIGALALYADHPRAFDEHDRAVAALFAAHAAVAYKAARERVRFEVALASRDVIGQAKGILMAQSHITSDEAFDLLRRASQRLNQKLVAVAEGVVNKNITT
ncbi:MAG: hypothetical protein JWL70_2564, partial [Acidimicrobiia bacterium]|nr:hypothetical protein [Acidimicrobiia bacterium]